jgi:hypothetical protein
VLCICVIFLRRVRPLLPVYYQWLTIVLLLLLLLHAQFISQTILSYPAKAIHMLEDVYCGHFPDTKLRKKNLTLTYSIVKVPVSSM